MASLVHFAYIAYIRKGNQNKYAEKLNAISEKYPEYDVEEISDIIKIKLQKGNVVSTELFLGFSLKVLPDTPVVLKNEIIMAMRKTGVIGVAPVQKQVE